MTIKMGLDTTVIKHNFCIGCGVCTTGSNSGYRIDLTRYGTYKAGKINNSSENEAEKNCLFSDKSLDESAISESLFKGEIDNFDEVLGYYKALYFGYDSSEENRINSSSGGLITWITGKMLETGCVDVIVHPKYNPENKIYYSYQLSHTIADIARARKSYYYPVEMSSVLKTIENDTSDKTYAIVAVPCFITNLRLLCNQNPHFKKKIKYFIGINCGHLKSTAFGEFLAWQNGVKPRQIERIDFRAKLKDRPAGDYALKIDFTESGNRNSLLSKPSNEHFGSNWGLGYFKYKACDYCDDVFAETADIVMGDAWIKPHVEDWRGTNVVTVRNGELLEILKSGVKGNEIELIPATKEEVKSTQAATIRHRRDGLSIRLWMTKDKWVPKKRVVPSKAASEKLYNIHTLRVKLRRRSHWAFRVAKKVNSLFVFKVLMYNITVHYFWVYGVYSKAVPPFLLKGYRYLKANIFKRVGNKSH